MMLTMRLSRDHLRKNSGSDDDVYDVLQESVVILYKQVTGEGSHTDSRSEGLLFRSGTGISGTPSSVTAPVLTSLDDPTPLIRMKQRI